jgi:hypothetical protein
MLSQKEKSVMKGVDLLFQGMEDDALKEIVLANALQKSEDEKERILEIIRQKKTDDIKYINEKFEIEINRDDPLKMLDLFKTYIEQNPQVVEEIQKQEEADKENN